MGNRTIYFDKISQIKVFDKTKQYEYLVKKSRSIFGITYLKGGVYSTFDWFFWEGYDKSNEVSFKTRYFIDKGTVLIKPHVIITMQDCSNSVFYFYTHKEAVDYYNEIRIKTNRKSLDL